MWQCPKCGRSFKNQNQDHFCGEPPKSIDEYIEAQSERVQPILMQVRMTIREILPDNRMSLLMSKKNHQANPLLSGGSRYRSTI